MYGSKIGGWINASAQLSPSKIIFNQTLILKQKWTQRILRKVPELTGGPNMVELLGKITSNQFR